MPDNSDTEDGNIDVSANAESSSGANQNTPVAASADDEASSDDASSEPDHQYAKQATNTMLVSNTHHHGSGAFEGFFKTLEAYLEDQAQVNPLEEVRSGAKKSFDMYFPEMHCDLYKKSSEKDRQTLQKPCDSKWVAGFKKAISPLARTSQFKSTLGMAC